MPVLNFILSALKGLAGLFASLFAYDPHAPDDGLHGGGRGNIFRWLLGTAIAIFSIVAAVGDVVQLYLAWWPYTVPATAVYIGLIQLGIWWPDGQETVPKGRLPLALLRVLVGILVSIVVLFMTFVVAGLIWLPIKYLASQWHYVVATLIFMVIFIGGPILWMSIFPNAADRKENGRRKREHDQMKRDRKRFAKQAADVVVSGGDKHSKDDLVS